MSYNIRTPNLLIAALNSIANERNLGVWSLPSVLLVEARGMLTYS